MLVLELNMITYDSSIIPNYKGSMFHLQNCSSNIRRKGIFSIKRNICIQNNALLLLLQYINTLLEQYIIIVSRALNGVKLQAIRSSSDTIYCMSSIKAILWPQLAAIFVKCMVGAWS